MKKEKIEIANVDKNDELILSSERAAQILSSLEKEFSAEPITWSALEKIKVPAGGATVWTLTENGEQIFAPHFDAIIAYNRGLRSYWEGAYTGDSRPPDCQSLDMLTGTSGRVCAQCPFSRYGSALTGKGQACKQLRLLVLLTPTKIFPFVLVLPPTSLNNFMRYRLRLVEEGLTSDSVLTRFTLIPAKSSQGIVYSQVQFEKVRNLTNIDLAPIKKIFEGLQIALTQEDLGYRDDGGGE